MSNDPYTPDRGDLIWLIFDPRTGHEQSGRRPALVLSPRFFTERTSLAIVCPITSNIKGLPFEVPLSKTKTAGAVLPIHVRSVDVKARKSSFIEKAPDSVVNQVTKSVEAIINSV